MHTISGSITSYALKEVTIPASVINIITNAFNGCYNLTNLNIYPNFNSSLELYNLRSLSKTCLCDIIYKLKDNSMSGVTNTIKFFGGIEYTLNNTYLDTSTGFECENTSNNASSLIDIIQSKNWTVSFAT